MNNWKVLQIHPQTHLKLGLYEEDIKYPSAAESSNQIKIRPKLQLS